MDKDNYAAAILDMASSEGACGDPLIGPGIHFYDETRSNDTHSASCKFNNAKEGGIWLVTVIATRLGESCE